jgi:hypothetical protein
MINTSVYTGRKPSLWLRMGSVAALAALTLTMSACSDGDGEKGAHSSPVNTESIGKDYATATPTPTATSSTGSSSSPSSTALPTIPSDIVNASALPASVTKEEIEEMQIVAKEFVKAQGGSSWKDNGPTAWIDRVAVYTTPEYQSELIAAYGEGSPPSKWEEMKANQTNRFVEISSANVGIGNKYSEGKVSIRVEYLVAVASNKLSATEVLSRHNKYVNLVKMGEEWKVASINNVAGGGA